MFHTLSTQARHYQTQGEILMKIKKNTNKKNMHAMSNLRVFFILIFYVYNYSFIYFCDNITFENPSIFINGFN